MAMYDSVIPGWKLDENLLSTNGISVIAEKNNMAHNQMARGSIVKYQTNRDRLIFIMNTPWLV